jgi:hypothetical protein
MGVHEDKVNTVQTELNKMIDRLLEDPQLWIDRVLEITRDLCEQQLTERAAAGKAPRDK